MKKLFGSLLLTLSMTSAALAAVDLNTATQAELEAVKGIGPSKAKAILVYREKHGAFKSVDELAKVKGFGKTSAAKMKKAFTVVGASASGLPAAKAPQP